jgi:AcrR family transcriptional regulator
LVLAVDHAVLSKPIGFGIGQRGLYTKLAPGKTDRYHGRVAQTDAHIAELAAQLFHEHGITATGVDAVSKAAGISKRTLYERFGSKDGLIAAAYSALDLPVFEHITGPAERASTTPRGQLEQLFAVLEAEVRSPQFRGCPFAAASSEIAARDHPAHTVIRRHKERLRRWILSRARAAGATDPARLSRQLMLVFDGAQAQSLVQRSARPAREAREVAKALLDTAVGPHRDST